MRKFTSVMLIMIASTALLAACDDSDTDDVGTVPVPGTAAAEATPVTPPAGTNGMGATPPVGTDVTAVPGDGEAHETRVEATITDSDLTVSPSSINNGDGDVVINILNNSTIDRDVVLVRMSTEDDSFTMFGLFEDDDVIDRAVLQVVGEIIVDADSEAEIGTNMIGADLEPGTYVIIATTVNGDGLLWAEFTVTDDESR